MKLAVATAQPELFGTAGLLPEGLDFVADFISVADERALLALFTTLPLHAARWKDYTARRRVFTYGARFDFDTHELRPGDVHAMPPVLQTLRERLARFVGIAPEAFIHAMVAEYRTGTPLGWHRDAPGYGLIAGVSLGGPARLRFRPYPPEAPRAPIPHDTVALDLAPRSAYVMRGVARWGWQHSVPPVPALRYAVTMRTARRAPAFTLPAASAASTPSARAP